LGAQVEHSRSAIPRRGHRNLWVALRMERTSPAFRQCRGRRSDARTPDHSILDGVPRPCHGACRERALCDRGAAAGLAQCGRLARMPARIGV